MEREFLQAASTVLQTEQGYYPAQVALPELDRELSEFDARLVQLDTYGMPFVILISVLDAARRQEFIAGKLREHYVETVRRALAKTGTKNARVSVVLVAEEALSAREARHSLGRTELQLRPRQELGFYWATPSRKLFQSGHRFFSLAPNRALNPCYPETNVFTRLLRRGWQNVGQAPASDRQAKGWQAERSFSERLLGRPTAVWVVLLINILVWYLTERLGGSKNMDVLIRCGAKVDGLIHAGQWWRLVTASFLHAGYMHMALNGLGLIVVGQTLERLYGSARFVIIYVLCGTAAGLASMALSHGVMVGASGAIFGLVGVLVAYGFRYRHDIPAKYQAMFGAGLLPLVGLNIVLGLIIPQIDNAAHMGGLVAGFALGMVLRPRTAHGARPWAWWVRRGALAAAVAAVAMAGYMAAQFYREYPTIAKVDLDFAAEHRMGPVKIELPDTWTVKRTSPNRWKASTSYCEADVEVIYTDKASTVAMERAARYFMSGGRLSEWAQGMIVHYLSALDWTGRVRLPLMNPEVTYVIVPGGLAELAVRGTGVARGPGAELAEVLRRVEESFQPATD